MNSPASNIASLSPQSPLGTAHGAAAKTLVNNAVIKVVEEPFLHLSSIRLSRVAVLEDVKALLPFSLGQLPNTFSGDADQAVARFEPRAWIVISKQPVKLPVDAAGALVTDLSARLAGFRISGSAAEKILASSTSVAVPAGGFVRTMFAENYAVLLQRLGEQDYRLLVDVSLAHSCADWLADNALMLGSN